MKHSPDYLEAKAIMNNPNKYQEYDDRDITRANYFVKGYEEAAYMLAMAPDNKEIQKHLPVSITESIFPIKL